MKKRKWLIGIFVLLILGAGAYWGIDYFQQKNLERLLGIARSDNKVAVDISQPRTGHKGHTG